MKRLLSATLLTLSIFAFSLSAHAVSVDLSDNSTAYGAFSQVEGLSFVTNMGMLNKLVKASDGAPYDVYMLAKSASYDNYIGAYNNGAFTAFNYVNNYDATGNYLGNPLVASDVLLQDLAIVVNGGQAIAYKQYANDFSTDTAPVTKPNGSTAKLQFFLVDADSVEINGITFYKGSIIFALDDGTSHVDFNDLVFVLAAKSPAVPIPGAAFLLAPGLAGLVALRRKMH